MPVKFISHPNSFQLSSKWQVVSINPDRTIVQNGQRFKVLYEAKLSDSIYSKRRTEALLKIIFTLGIAYFCSKKIKSHLSQKECVFITSIPEEERPAAVTKVQEVSVQHLEESQFTLEPKPDRSNLLTQFKRNQLPIEKEEEFINLLTREDYDVTSPSMKDLFFRSASDDKLKDFVNLAEGGDTYNFRVFIQSLKEENIPRLVAVIQERIPSFVNAITSKKIRESIVEPLIIALYQMDPTLKVWKETKMCGFEIWISTFEILKVLESTPSDKLYEKMEAFVNSYDSTSIFTSLFPKLKNLEEEKLQILTRFFLEKGARLLFVVDVISKNHQSSCVRTCLTQLMQFIIKEENKPINVKEALVRLFEASQELIPIIQSLEEEPRRLYLGAFRDWSQKVKKQDVFADITPLNIDNFKLAYQRLKPNKLLKELDNNPKHLFQLTSNEYHLFQDLETFSSLKKLFFKNADDNKLQEFVDFACRGKNYVYSQLDLFMESLEEENIPRLVSVIKDRIPEFVQSLGSLEKLAPQLEPLIIALYETEPSLEIWEEIKYNLVNYGHYVLTAEVLRAVESASTDKLQGKLESIDVKTFSNKIFRSLVPRLILKNIEEEKLQIVIHYFFKKDVLMINPMLENIQSDFTRICLREWIQFSHQKTIHNLFQRAFRENKALELVQVIQSLEENERSYYLSALHEYAKSSDQKDSWEKVLQGLDDF